MHNRKQSIKKYERVKAEAYFASHPQKQKYLDGVSLLGWVGIGLGILLIGGCFFYPEYERQLLLTYMVIFLGCYYLSVYEESIHWLIYKEGVWSRLQVRPMTWENIIGYEWRQYRGRLILRISYKGRGIMLQSTSLVVSPEEQQAVTALLNQWMAGM